MSFSPPVQPAVSSVTHQPTSSSFSVGDGNDNPPPPPPVARKHAYQESSLALRSCITCRRRKVRCDKRTPCSNCAKANIECIFPPPGRAPRKMKRPPTENAELLSRLRQLESMVEAAITNNGQVATSPPQQHGGRSSGDAPARSQLQPSQDEAPVRCQMAAAARQSQVPSLEHEFGRLVIDDNRSRYVSNRFWASLGDQIEELQDILDPSSSDDDDHHSSPESSSGYNTVHAGSLFGFYSQAYSLRDFHPPSNKVQVLWSVYAENVKPLLPVIYGPTAQQLFAKAAQPFSSLDRNTEALVLAMYFAAIVSMSPEQCITQLGEGRDTMIGRYRFAVEQALSKANLLNTQSLTLMQAAVIFLNAVRRDDDTKYVWSMSALILRLAQGLGLHRDGNNFNLKPFDAEMRRRLWWHIVLLDLRSSEDHGTDVQIHDRMFDTRLPLNVNDSDISPHMTERPTPREEFTDMTFFLIRCDICYALRRVAYTCPNTSGAVGGPTPDNCSNVVQTVNKHIEEQYLKYCDMSDPIQWISATVARLVLTKMWLVIHHPVTRADLEVQISQESRESLFITSIEVTEFARLIKEDESTKKWSWMFDAHMQWHAIAMVLSELCVRPLSPLTDRAWFAVTTVYDDWLRTAKQRKGMLWRPLAKLMERAGALRKRQVAELVAQVEHQHTVAQGRTTSIPTDSDRPVVGSPFSSHFPEHSRLAAAAPPMDWEPSKGPLDFDISQGPMGVLNSFFPEGNFFAIPQDLASTAPQAPLNIQSQAPPSLNVPMSISTTQPKDISPDASNPGANYQEWDQVLRDFQMDMQEVHGDPVGDMTGWIA
ncbi:putative C6 transcription factor [Aspergillus undulatus]|uniref:putative C6 transcription factor n=1 Tax=Aspergillus undulatus TaxID=1810928 RepID=UPI003CCCFA0F